MSLTKSSVATLHARIAELEAEQDQLQKTFKEISDEHDQVDAENAALRKALEDAPHDGSCALGYPPGSLGDETPYACDCWKASIPQPTPQTLAASSPDGERAGKP